MKFIPLTNTMGPLTNQFPGTVHIAPRSIIYFQSDDIERLTHVTVKDVGVFIVEETAAEILELIEGKEARDP